MRRKHNVIAATLFILGIVFLCVQREGKLADYDLLHDKNKEQNDRQREPAELKFGSGTRTTLVTGPLPLPTSEDAVFSDGQSLSPVGVPEHPHDPVIVPAASLQPDLSAGAPTIGLNDLGGHNPGASTGFHPDFTFQQNLDDVELPFNTLQSFSKHAPLHYGDEIPKTFAYATFMSTHNPSIKDPYYLAIHSVVHRVLWSAQSRTQEKYPFIVFVAEYVTQEQRDLLAGAGAIIRELPPLDWHCNKENFQARWTDLFAKLHMWAHTDFQRLLFLDADAFPLSNIDDMFELAPVQQCIEHKVQLDDFLPDQSKVCEPYIFAGVPQDSDLNHPLYPNINVGSMVFTPSARMHTRLLQNYLKYDYYDCAMAEQAFLNWQFSHNGAFPSTLLERKWGAFFPQKDEEGKLKVLHQKIWSIGDEWMKKEWVRGMDELVTWYNGEEFKKVRGALGVVR